MSPPARPAIGHVALTVTDVEASIAWYSKVFDIKQLMEEEHKGGTGKVLATEDLGFVIVLHRHDDNAGERFGETRTGLDHVGMNLPTLAGPRRVAVALGVLRREACRHGRPAAHAIADRRPPLRLGARVSRPRQHSAGARRPGRLTTHRRDHPAATNVADRPQQTYALRRRSTG